VDSRLLIIPQVIFSTLGRWFGLRRPRNGDRRIVPNPAPAPPAADDPKRRLADRWLRLGVSAALADEQEEATHCFVQAAHSDPSFARAWLYLGGIVGEPAQALAALRRAYRLAPDDLQIRTGLVWARYRLGLITKPLEQATSPLDKGVATPGFGLPSGFQRTATPALGSLQADALGWLQLGVSAAVNGSRIYARYCFAKAAALPVSERRLEEVLTRRRSWLYLAGVCGQPEQTLALLEQVLHDEPDNVEALSGVRWAAGRLGLSSYQWRGGWPPDTRLGTDPLLKGPVGEGVSGLGWLIVGNCEQLAGQSCYNKGNKTTGERKQMIVIVGGGLAGLTCAKVLRERGRAVLLLEASDGVGGRVRSDVVAGFTLDRGFQVYFTAYPAGKRHLDYAALDFRTFDPAGIVVEAGKRSRLGDPLRAPQYLFETLTSPYATLGDRLRLVKLVGGLLRESTETTNQRHDNETTYGYLKRYGFSARFIHSFIQPFVGGQTLNRQLTTAARVFRFDFKMLAQGRTVVPAKGIGAISEQLASHSPGCIRLNTSVAGLLREGGRVVGVQTAGGEQIAAEAVVVATESPIAAHLTGLELPTAGLVSTCVYFASPRSLHPEKAILLNANGDLFINNLIQISNVAPEYAPAGQHLLSCSIIALPELSDEQIVARAREDLARIFGSAANEVRPLRVIRIPFGQFAQPPGQQSSLPANYTGTPGLYLAGEYTSFASINGAISSGERAARAVITKV